jgi:hypothetical protein
MQLIQAVVFSILPLLVLSQHVDHYQQPFNLERCMLRTGAARFSLVANAVSSAAKRFEPGQKGFHNMAFGNAAQHNYAIKQPELKKTVDVAQDAVKHMEKTPECLLLSEARHTPTLFNSPKEQRLTSNTGA